MCASADILAGVSRAGGQQRDLEYMVEVQQRCAPFFFEEKGNAPAPFY
jgi:hypothetical protein